MERQGSEAFADFELMERAGAICRAAISDFVEARDDEDGSPGGSDFLPNRANPKTVRTLPVTLARPRLRSPSIAPADESPSLIDG